MASLQDQLLKAGMVDEKKAKKLKKEKRKAEKGQKGKVLYDQDKEQARLGQQEKAARDKALNKERQDAAEEKAIAAQIIQMIQTNKIDRGAGELAYQFADGAKIKKLYITTQLQKDLVAGRIAIVRLANSYELLPAVAARKIMQRDEHAVVVLNSKAAQTVDEDDPYAGYEVPDDLMW